MCKICNHGGQRKLKKQRYERWAIRQQLSYQNSFVTLLCCCFFTKFVAFTKFVFFFFNKNVIEGDLCLAPFLWEVIICKYLFWPLECVIHTTGKNNKSFHEKNHSRDWICVRKTLETKCEKIEKKKILDCKLDVIQHKQIKDKMELKNKGFFL